MPFSIAARANIGRELFGFGAKRPQIGLRQRQLRAQFTGVGGDRDREIVTHQITPELSRLAAGEVIEPADDQDDRAGAAFAGPGDGHRHIPGGDARRLVYMTRTGIGVAKGGAGIGYIHAGGGQDIGCALGSVAGQSSASHTKPARIGRDPVALPCASATQAIEYLQIPATGRRPLRRKPSSDYFLEIRHRRCPRQRYRGRRQQARR